MSGPTGTGRHNYIAADPRCKGWEATGADPRPGLLTYPRGTANGDRLHDATTVAQPRTTNPVASCDGSCIGLYLDQLNMWLQLDRLTVADPWSDTD
jgi:hypothetical protein